MVVIFPIYDIPSYRIPYNGFIFNAGQITIFHPPGFSWSLGDFPYYTTIWGEVVWGRYNFDQMYGIFTLLMNISNLLPAISNNYLGISPFCPQLVPVYNGFLIAHLYATKVSVWGPAVMFGFFPQLSRRSDTVNSNRGRNSTWNLKKRAYP